MHQHSHPRRSSFRSSTTSTCSSILEDTEASNVLLPAVASPDESQYQHSDLPQGHDGNRHGSACSVRSCGGMSFNATKELWICMLELQQVYGCYNSTRMDLAVGAGEDAIGLMPNPFILDTLNDSVVDLPEEGWERLNQCLENASHSP